VETHDEHEELKSMLQDLIDGVTPPENREVTQKVSTSRLPSTGKDLFGREQHLRELDAAWDDPKTNIVSFIAWGGVGKSALVNHWLASMATQDYGGAERVFGWSFYSQGTKGRTASADIFIDKALREFGDPNPTEGSAREKGERLAGLVKAKRTLLILDGLEPLQHPPGPLGGALKDQSMQALVRDLCAQNPGLCVISSRLPLADLEDYEDCTAKQIDLENLPPEAGAELLRSTGVTGEQGELEQASRDLDGHALALTLLGNLLSERYQGDVRCRSEMGPLAYDGRQGQHARNVMSWYARLLGEGPELCVLRMIGLFDRPADGASVKALRQPPAIRGLTDRLGGLSDPDWQGVLDRLRRAGLLAQRSEDEPDTLDAHPLVREHFGEELKERHPEAWREGNDRIYAHLKSTAKELPDTIEEMAPLYAAVIHGCRAGRYQEALDDVYWRRIQRGRVAFSTHKLGALGAELAALSGFFEEPWSRPVEGLRGADKSFVQGEAGFNLRALGRLREAIEPMEVSLPALIRREDWRNAARRTDNLSELHVTMGDVERALDCARQSVEHADRSGDGSLRIIMRTVLADALHQAGRIDEAEELFGEAEKMQKERQTGFPLLYSLQGYQYCDLLLGRGEHAQVLSRAREALKVATPNNWLLAIALDNLSLGRAHLLRAIEEGTANFTEAEAHLDRAVDGLRRAGQQDELPRGLLARAGLRRVQGGLDLAGKNLDEAFRIASRGGMRLHEADCHLEYARLHLARGDAAKAGESLDRAGKLVEETGYRRRDGEVAELRARLGN
jgi:tetratricopeptide (TPR) repeat protein